MSVKYCSQNTEKKSVFSAENAGMHCNVDSKEKGMQCISEYSNSALFKQ